MFKNFIVFLILGISGVVADLFTCSYSISHNCRSTNPFCLSSLDEAFNKLNTTTCDHFEAVLDPDAAPYNLTFRNKVTSSTLKNLTIKSSKSDSATRPQIIINEAHVKLTDINLFMRDLDFNVSLAVLDPTIFDLKVERSSEHDCSLNNIAITGANDFTLGTFLGTMNYNVTLENISIANNSIAYIDNNLPLFEFFRVSTNITMSWIQNNSLTISNLSVTNNTYQPLSSEAQVTLLNMLKKANISIASYLERISSQNSAIVRTESISRCNLSSIAISKNHLSGSLFIVDQPISGLSYNFKANGISFASNSMNYSSFIDLRGYIENARIDEVSLNQNYFDNYSSVVSLPTTFYHFTLDQLTVSNNTFTQSYIVEPLIGATVPIFSSYYGIVMSNMDFTENLFRDYSVILAVTNYESGVQIYNWNFTNNTFLSMSSPVSVSQASGLGVHNSLFQSNYVERYLLKAVLVDELVVTENQFLNSITEDLTNPETAKSMGGILQGEVCGQTIFSDNKVHNFFSVNYEAIVFNDEKCENRAESNETVKFNFENNSFRNCTVIGLNSYNSLISMQYNFARRLIEFHNNTFINNSLETSVNYIRGATNLIIYSTISRVTIKDCTFMKNKANSQISNIGIFVLELLIENSAFEDNGVSEFTGLLSNYVNLGTTGGAITAAANFMYISGCRFKRNYAQAGGAIYLERSNTLIPLIEAMAYEYLKEGLMIIMNSTFNDNSADYGGAINFASSQLNQSLTIANCEFKYNRANFSGGAYFSGIELISQYPLKMKNCTFQRNSAAQGGAIYYMSVANLTLSGCTLVSYSQFNLMTLKHSNSTVRIEKTQFYGNPRYNDTEAELVHIDGSVSTKLDVVFSECKFYNIPNAGDRTPSILNIRGSSAWVWAEYSNFTDIYFGKYGIIHMREGAQLRIKNSSFSRVFGLFRTDDNFTQQSRLAIDEDSGAIAVTTSSKLYVSDSDFTDINGSLILVMDPMSGVNLKRSTFKNISGIDGSALDLHGESLLTDNNQTQIIENCSFIGCVAETFGGAIVSQAMNFRISGTTFENCSSRTGGAIRIVAGTQTSIVNSVFTGNKAEYGGAISYISTKPPAMSKNTFSKNRATVYGNNTASYASKIVLYLNNRTYYNISFDNQTSQQPLDIPGKRGVVRRLEFQLRDKDDQIVVYDNTGLVTFQIETSTNETQQLLLERADQGRVFVEAQSLRLYGLPGTNSTIYATHVESGTSVKIMVRLRECERGEIRDNKANTCFKCGVGTYSLNTSENKCQPCPANADCYGGYNISLHRGFWRESVNSTKIIACEERNHCLGGYLSLCDKNTTGVLCASCNSNATPPLVKTISGRCEECNRPVWMYGLFLLGIFSVILLLGILLLYLTIESNYSFTREGADLRDRISNKSKKNLGIYLRMIFMHGQLIMLLKHSCPGLSDLLGVFVNLFGEPISNMLFFAKCWVIQISDRVDQAFFENILMIAIPVILFVVLACYIKFFRKSYFAKAKNYEYFSAVLLIFLWMQPEVLASQLSMVFCTEVSEGKWYLSHHMETLCDGAAFTLRRTITTFGIIAWMVLLPLYFLTELYKSQERLRETRTRMRLGLLYHGYKTSYFYWGALAHFFRSVMILIYSLWSTPTPLQGLTLMVIAVIYLILIARIRPHIEEYTNETEIDLLLVFITVIFCVTNYNDQNTSKFMKKVWYVSIIVANVYFFIKVLGGIFSSVKQIMTPVFNAMAVCCFWSKRYRKVMNQKKHEKKKLPRTISTHVNARTQTSNKVDIALKKTRNKTEWVLNESSDGLEDVPVPEMETQNSHRNTISTPLLPNKVSKRMA